jgi:hypothetical protein
VGALACGRGEEGALGPTALDGMSVARVLPDVVVPGTTLSVVGQGFVDESVGTTRLHLEGQQGGTAVERWLSARFVDALHLEASVDGLPEGELVGTLVVEVEHRIDGQRYVSAPYALRLRSREALEPRLDKVLADVVFVNDSIQVWGDGLLLGGEGETLAVLSGCLSVEDAASCVPLPEATLPVSSAGGRSQGSFVLAPEAVGIRPGRWTGTATLVNRHGEAAGRVETRSAPWPMTLELVLPQVFPVVASASLGQMVVMEGGGFVPASATSSTTLELAGTFADEATGTKRQVAATLVPEVVRGSALSYVLWDKDDLGRILDLRRGSGTLVGTLRPLVSWRGDTVEGEAAPIALTIGHVKQVVWLNFLPSYVDSLRHFGLRAVDSAVRQRVLEVVRRDYAGVNLELRLERPVDFAWFAQVDIAGPDPNGLSLLGYDNSPGKDSGNLRLYDTIGGVNAATQADGYPGYGGVFLESFFGFSAHPGAFAAKGAQAEPLFDEIFDPLRLDRGGRPVTAADLAQDSDAARLTSGAQCPVGGRAPDRQREIACAVWVLGSMMGTTLSHEVGHSLGLANPYGDGYHDPGDQPNRLMDAGGDRTFAERAELLGQGPGVFCDTEYDYLREILPTRDPFPKVQRPTCR